MPIPAPTRKQQPSKVRRRPRSFTQLSAPDKLRRLQRMFPAAAHSVEWLIDDFWKRQMETIRRTGCSVEDLNKWHREEAEKLRAEDAAVRKAREEGWPKARAGAE